MNLEKYKIAWKSFEQSPVDDYSPSQIEAIVKGQTKQTAYGWQYYLKLDLVIKILSLIVLVTVVYLFRTTQHLWYLGSSTIIGILVAWRQGILLSQSKILTDFTQPIKDVVAQTLNLIKSRLKLSSLLIGLTNPIFILTGSFVYYYFKYGTGYQQDPMDTLVTVIIMTIGFVIGYAAFKLQQQAQLNDLETSLAILSNESDEPLQYIAQRRKRRIILSIGLVVVGLALFFFLIINYLNL